MNNNILNAKLLFSLSKTSFLSSFCWTIKKPRISFLLTNLMSIDFVRREISDHVKVNVKEVTFLQLSTLLFVKNKYEVKFGSYFMSAVLIRTQKKITT